MAISAVPRHTGSGSRSISRRSRLSTCRITSARASNARPAYLAINPQGLVPALEDDAGAGPHPIARHRRMAGRDPSRTGAAAKGSAAAGQSACLCDGARLRHPPGAESESIEPPAAARRGRGKGDGVGGLGQPRGARRLRSPDRRREGAVLLRRQRPPSPIFAWCRSLPMRGASASTSRPIRACSRPRPRQRK